MLSRVNLWEAEDFPLPLVQRVCLVCSEATQHPFLTNNRDTSVMDIFKEWKRPERQPGQRKASSPLQLWCEFPPPCKTMRAGTQWWGTRWVIPKCMSQMNSPEWLDGGDSTTPTTPKCTQVGTKMFTWSTTPMSRTRQVSRNIERGKRERDRE